MNLIASGAYLQGGFSTEIGLTPPSFLPIGNKRLYEYQVELLRNKGGYDDDIYLSIPESYRLSTFDLMNLNKLKVNIIAVPDGLSLGSSILYCWNAAAKIRNKLTLLHGDTLFLNFDFESKNALSVHPNRGYYKRAKLEYESDNFKSAHDEWSNDSDLVLSGLFNFEYPLYFMKSLVEEDNDFTEAIVRYHQNYPVELVDCGEWLDFGHINSFYHSRSKMTTQRAFNDLKINQQVVTKASISNPKKIFSEGRWFAEIPLALRIYTPALLSLFEGDANYNGSSYKLEYLYFLPLSDLMIFGNLSEGSWVSIFESINKALIEFNKYKPSSEEACKVNNDDLYLSKTLKRLNDFEIQSGVDLSISKYGFLDHAKLYNLKEIAINSALYIKDLEDTDISVMHGDFCFSNILFDSRAEVIKCIDPRGITLNDELSIYGDRRYDISKIYHSLVGMYDFIIAGHYELNIIDEGSIRYFDFKIFNEDNLYDIEALFRDILLSQSDYSEKEILSITIQLFLSMLPLHSEKPMLQQAFIANSIRLYYILEEMEL